MRIFSRNIPKSSIIIFIIICLASSLLANAEDSNKIEFLSDNSESNLQYRQPLHSKTDKIIKIEDFNSLNLINNNRDDKEPLMSGLKSLVIDINKEIKNNGINNKSKNDIYDTFSNQLQSGIFNISLSEKTILLENYLIQNDLASFGQSLESPQSTKVIKKIDKNEANGSNVNKNQMQLKDLKAGVIVNIKYSTMKETVFFFLPELLDYFKHFKIKPTQNTIETLLLNVNIEMSDGYIAIDEIPKENVKLAFIPGDPYDGDHVRARIQNLKGKSRFTISVSTKISSTWSFIDVYVKNLSVTCRAQLQAFKSKKHLGKLLPTVKITFLYIDVDLDFDIEHGVASWFDYLFKQQLKTILIEAIQTEIADYVKENNARFLGDYLESDYPLFQNIKENMYIDNGLSFEPVMLKDSYVFGTLGTMFNSVGKNKQEMSEIIPYTQKAIDIDFSNLDTENINAYVSEYVLNTFLYSAGLNNLLSYTFTNDIIPEEAMIKLNSTNMNLLFPGFEDVAGVNKEVSVDCSVDPKEQIPNAYVTTGKIRIDKLKVICKMYADASPDNKTTNESENSRNLNNRKFIFSFTVINDVSAKADIGDNTELKLQIEEVKAYDFHVIESLIENISTSTIEQLVNVGSTIGLPIVNAKVLDKGIKIPLPTIQDIDFSKSQVHLREGYIEISCSPVFLYDQKKERLETEKKKRDEEDKKKNVVV